ncbi:MAG: fasciclin domain-containing protein, partial [Candidatus Poseidonia sp.]|nr:fasciclin domain-containing protein [Poseidonia sp.]
ANLLSTLEGEGPFTVFAPTDQAFTDLGVDLSTLSQSDLSDILLYHVVEGNVPSTALSDCMSAQAANGQSLSFTVGDSVMVNNAGVSRADVATSNGVIHMIDKVLTPTDTPTDIPRTAQCNGNHNSLVAGVVQAELLATLQGDGPFTVFAPTDQAFADAGIDLASLDTPEGKTVLSDILLYHVLDGEVPAANVSDCMNATAVNGQPLSFTVGTSVMINGATVTATDVPTSNGIIHVIDKVLTPTDTPNDIPRTAQCTGVHDSLVAAVIQAELLETLQGEGPFTVFAPTDQAFADAGIDLTTLDNPEGALALSEILLSHVVAGSVLAEDVVDCMTAETVSGHTLAFSVGDAVMVNGATVSTVDVMTSNGVIHVIDTVLSPLANPNDIPRTAQCTGAHDSLVAAIIQAELLETLQGEGPFTVFAPTDQAFADAGIDLAALNTVEGKETLTEILLSHVVAGTVLATNVSDCMTAETLSGHSLSFTVDDSVKVNGATVTTSDVLASNGVIHVIDTVLTPTNVFNDLTRTATCTGVHTSLVAALIQAELVETLQGDGPFTVFAPTDQAFADAGIDLAALDTEEGKETLTDILLYHVYSGNFVSSEITEGKKLRMLNGDDAVLSPTEGIEGANITLADVQTSNGVIHVLDKVLMPPADSETDGDTTAATSSEDDGGNLLIIGIVLIVAIVGGLLVVRFVRRGDDGLEAIQALGKVDVDLPQTAPVAQATATTAYASEAANTTYQSQTYQQPHQPAVEQVAQPAVAQPVNDSALSAFIEAEIGELLDASEPVQASASVSVETVQPAAEPEQPAVQNAEPHVLQQWTDDNGHTWRVMSDNTHRWWNGTDWQKV